MQRKRAYQSKWGKTIVVIVERDVISGNINICVEEPETGTIAQKGDVAHHPYSAFEVMAAASALGIRFDCSLTSDKALGFLVKTMEEYIESAQE